MFYHAFQQNLSKRIHHWNGVTIFTIYNEIIFHIIPLSQLRFEEETVSWTRFANIKNTREEQKIALFVYNKKFQR